METLNYSFNRRDDAKSEQMDTTSQQFKVLPKKKKKIKAFISNEPQQLFLDVVKIMKPNNALPGIFLCLKFGSHIT